MRAVPTPVPRSLEAEEASAELGDVPAAVVCATCGSPECAGCEPDRVSMVSGVVAIIPWERPGAGLAGRIWNTARLTVLSPEAFFGGLPQGRNWSPLGFALIAEGLAALGLCSTLGALAALLVPGLAQLLLSEPELRSAALRVTLLVTSLLSSVMVTLHALHGLALDRAARRYGSSQPGRGLRFGFYSCGWDLITLPLGLFLLCFTDGPVAALRATPRSLTAPRRSARAYLMGVHRLDEAQAERASRRAIARLGVPLLLGLTLLVGCALVLVWRHSFG